MLFYDGVPTFTEYDDEGGLLVVTEAEADRMARDLGPHRAQLLEGHGANVVGGSLQEAVVTTFYFVKNAELLLAGRGLGDLTWDVPGEDVARATVDRAILSDIAVDRLWDYLTRRLPDR
jgi:ribulose-5-phosphate 4-epimerase/fuculose-1-phosphate aldolase